MFEGVSGDELAEAVAELDRLTARVAAMVGAFDRSGGWAAEGAVSVVGWLRGRGLASADAGRLAGLGRRLSGLPVLSEAWRDGEVTGGQVQAVVRAVPERHAKLFASHEAEVVPALAGLSVGDTVRAMRHWSARADALNGEGAGFDRGAPERSVRLSKTLGDRFVLDGDLDAEGGSVLSRALELADSGDISVHVPQRRADALVDIARFFLDNQQGLRGGRHRPHLNVVVDASDLASGGGGDVVGSGARLDRASVSRLLCDCALNRVVAGRLASGGSAVLDYGTSVRTVPASLWSALVVRDRHCRFPGCDRPPSWSEAHHVRWLSRGGPTSLDNLVLVCTRHHHLLHSRAGFEAKLLPDATFEVTLPSGVVRSTHPPPLGLF